MRFVAHLLKDLSPAAAESSRGIFDKRSLREALRQILTHGSHRLDNSVRIRELAGRDFGMDSLAIDRDFKRAPAGWDELQRGNVLLQLEEFVRQTDGMRLVISSCAIFDDNIQSHNNSR